MPDGRLGEELGVAGRFQRLHFAAEDLFGTWLVAVEGR